MKKKSYRNPLSMIIVFALIITMFTPAPKVSAAPSAIDYYVNKGNDPSFDKINSMYDMGPYHFFRFEDYLKNFGNTVSYFTNEGVSDHKMLLQYSVYGNKDFSQMYIKTYINLKTGKQYSYIQVYRDNPWEYWESRHEVFKPGDFMLDVSNDNFFYVAGQTFALMRNLVESKNPLENVKGNPYQFPTHKTKADFDQEPDK